MKRHIAGIALRVLSLAALAAGGNAAWAQTAPPNDNWANAIQIPALTSATPYSDTEANVNIATVETTDPLITCKAQVTPTGGGGVGILQQYRGPGSQMAQTVWYTYTTGANVEYVNIKAIEAAFNTTYFDPIIAVWTGTPATGFHMVTGGCNDDGVAYSAANNWSHVAGLRLQPNTTYSIEIAFNPLLTGNYAMPAADVLRVDVAAATVINVDTTTDAVPVDFSTWTSNTTNPCLTPTGTFPNGTCSLRAAIETAQILGEANPTAAGANGAAILVPAGDYYVSPWATTPNDASTTGTGTQNIGGGDMDLWGSMGIYGAGMGQTTLHASMGTNAGGPAMINGYTNTAWNERIFNSQTISTLSGTAPPTFATGEASWVRTNKVNTIITDMTLLGTGSTGVDPVNGPATSQGPGGLAVGPGQNGFGAFERVEFKNGLAAKSNSGAKAPQGGGAVQLSGKGQFRDCVFTNNTAGVSGGAIAAQNTPDFGFIEVSGSTFSGNFAAGDGSTGTNGALATAGGGAILSNTYLSITNSTLTGNSTNGYGGAILLNGTSYPFNALNGQSPLTDIRSSTIVGNNANANGNGYGLGGGIYIDTPSSLNSTLTQASLPNTSYIANSIFANNAVYGNASDEDADCSVTPSAQGAMYVDLAISNSLVKTPGAGVCAASGNGNITRLDPLLGALANNGGLAQTMALQSSSPAVDAGNPAGCTGHFGNVLLYDQRGSGYIRSAGMRCDMGAFELFGVAAAPGTPVLAAASDSGDSSSDGITNVTTPMFAGICGTSGDTVTVAVDNGAEFTNGTCNAGTYTTVAATTLAAGTHTIEAFESNSNGPSPLSGSGSFTIVLVGPAIAFTTTPPAWEDGVSNGGDDQFDYTVTPSRPSTCTLDGQTQDCSTLPVDFFSLTPGQHTFVVTAADFAGNVSTQSYTWQIGTPSAPTAVLTAASDTGISNTDGITNADPLMFQIACTNGDSIQLFEDGNAAGAPAVCAGGTVSISLAGVIEGMHAMTAQATRATAVGAMGNATTIVIDRTAPTLMLTGSPSSSVVSSTAAFTFTTDDSATAMLCQLDSGTPATCNSGSVTYTGLGVGAHTFTVTSTDLAGNAATPIVYNWSIVQPPTSGVMLAPTSDSGRLNSDGITNALNPVFIGSCTDGDTIQLYDSGNAIGSSVACSGGGYAITLSNLAEGTHAITMTATRNGITSAQSAPPAQIVVDRTAPDAPAINSQTGTAGLAATLNGLAEPNASVIVYDGSTPVCSAIADANANWSCSGQLAGSGTRSLTATATDVAGNTSVASPAFSLTAAGNDRIFRDSFGG